MREIALTKGKVAVVDADDFDRVSAFKWYYEGTGYAARRDNMQDWRLVKMHRFILGVTYTSTIVDHINRNTLDNRKENLRVSDKSCNAVNSKRRSDNTTGFKGVQLIKRTGKYSATVVCRGRRYWIGTFDDPFSAAVAWDVRAQELFGEHVDTNF